MQTLLHAGLIGRTIDPSDSRRTRLEATASGKTLHAAVRESIESLLEPFLAGLGEAQEQFLGLLETLSDQLTASPDTQLISVGEK